MIIYGWGKDVKQVAYAGIEKCPHCKNHGHFWICEHSSHATLYFIKVAKWSKKLLYMCATCERGWELDESVREEAIKRTIGLPTEEQCLQMWSRLDSASSKALTASREMANDQTIQMLGDAIAATVEELKAMHQEDHVTYVAGRFVAFLRDQDRPR